MSEGAQLAASLGRLSREDRALAVTACTLAGRRALELAKLLPDARAASLASVVEAALTLPVKERIAALGAEARRLALVPRLDVAALHPERRARLLAEAGEAGSATQSLCASALGEPLPPPARAANAAALSVLDAFLRERIAPPPWPDEVAATPPKLRSLLQAPPAQVAAVADALGPARLRALVDAMSPSAASWLLQRLPLAWDERLAATLAAPAEVALAALDQLTRPSPPRAQVKP